MVMTFCIQISLQEQAMMTQIKLLKEGVWSGSALFVILPMFFVDFLQFAEKWNQLVLITE